MNAWGIFQDGKLLARFTGPNAEHDASDATMTGEYPDEVEVAFINEPEATKIIVKRRFAVILEDAFEVEVADQHAEVDIDAVYAKANDDADTTVRKLWEDEHKADLDFPEAEIIVEDLFGNTIKQYETAD